MLLSGHQSTYFIIYFYISIDSVRHYSPEATAQFIFLKNLRDNKDDWELEREKLKKEYQIKKRGSKINMMEEENELEESIRTNKGKDDIDNIYGIYGPQFYTLSNPLQVHLVKFLESLEVMAEVNNFMKYLSINRERREYIAWLFKIIKFLNFEEVEKKDNLDDVNIFNRDN